MDQTTPNLKEIPSQVEVWTSNYLVPTLQFAEWRRRFSVGDKLVFLLNFSNPGVYRQKVRIEWLWDADAPPPYLIKMELHPEYVDIDNQRYRLRLISNEGFSHAIDWTFSMYYKNYHVEYSMNGIGFIRADNVWWIPHILPAGNWTVLVGPIRAVAYRDTSRTYRVEYQNGYKEYYDDLGPFKHTEIALIPYNTKYWQLYNNIIWLNNYTDRKYYSFLTMVSGTSGDWGSQIRISKWAHQTKKSVHNGTYYDPPINRSSDFDNDQNFLYWYAQYRPPQPNLEGFGEAVLASRSYFESIISLFPGNYEMHIWATADYARRVIDCLAQKFNSSNTYMTIKKGTTISWFAGVWAYDGNGYDEPDMYHRMFVESYFPTIVSVSAVL